jgi:hypothetical protein
MNLAAPCAAEGHFSVVDPTPFTVEAEPGLVIHVHSGWLRVPGGDSPGVRIGPGGRYVAPGGGLLTVNGAERTHVELLRPGRAGARS